MPLILTIFKRFFQGPFSKVFYGYRVYTLQSLFIALLTASILCLTLLHIALAENGSDKLIDQWSKEKRQIREYILNDLERQGIKIPKTGSILFEAIVKPRPDAQNIFDYELRKLQVHIHNSTVNQKNTSKDILLHRNATDSPEGLLDGVMHGTIQLGDKEPPRKYFKLQTIRIYPIQSENDRITKGTKRK